MKKTMIALSLGLLPLAAAADVTLYGQVRNTISVNQVKIKGSDGTEKSAVATRINDNATRIGFRGSEKLSDDVKAIWQIEQRTSILGSDSRWGSRDSFIGLEGGFGKVRAGNLNNMLNEMDTIDPWMYSHGAIGLGVFTRTGTRTTSVRYDSPKLGGAAFSLQYSPRDNQNPADRYTHNEPARDQFTAGVSYSTPSYFAKLA